MRTPEYESSDSLFLKSPKHAVFRAGVDTDQVHQMNNDHEYAKYAADHHQSPGHLVRALIFLTHGAEFGLCKHTETDEEDGQAETYDPVEHDDAGSTSRG